MSESTASYQSGVRQKHRIDTIERILALLSSGALVKLPDIFLILIERALNRDLPGVIEMARHHWRNP